MLKKTPQNHAWSREYPAQLEWRNILKVVKNPNNIFTLIILIILFIFGVQITLSVYEITILSNNKAIFGICFLPLLIFSMFIFHKLAKKNITAQLKYYEINNIQEPTLEQAQALQLLLCLDYNLAHWNETLEYYPMLEKTNTQDFGGFMVSSVERERHKLHETWGVLLEKEYHQLIEMMFTNGVMTAKFLYKYILDDDGIQRLSKLSSIPEKQIYSYINPNNRNERKLLWGYEFVNVICVSRQAYMAQIISEDVAWSNILKASSYIHTLFDDFDDFYQNYILGNSVSFESIEKANERWNEYLEYQNNCNWRFKNLSWHKQNVELPEIVYTAYSTAIDNISQSYEPEENEPRQKIGFI